MKDFIKIVLSQRGNFENQILSYSDINKVQDVVMQSLNIDNVKDLRDRYEGLDFYNKFSLQIFGVIALEKILKTDLISWDKIDPRDYNAIIQIDEIIINVITSEYGEFPIIDKEFKRPTIFCFKRDRKDIWICGIADKDILDQNQSDVLLKGSMTKNLDSKTTFIGFHKLKRFGNIEELKNILNN